MSELKFLSDKQLSQVKDFISLELLKRGYTAPIVKFREVNIDEERSRIEFCTESFQTVPVLFKELYICNFSSNIALNSELTSRNGVEVYNIWLQVSVRYKGFDNGSNGTILFDYACTFIKGEERVFDEKIA